MRVDKCVDLFKCCSRSSISAVSSSMNGNKVVFELAALFGLLNARASTTTVFVDHELRQ